MVDVGGGGHLKVSLEAVRGTYTAATVTVPIESESLQEVRTDSWRSPLLGRAVTQGKVGGRAGVEGTIVMEALPYPMVYFLAASRWGNNIAEGGIGPWTYTATDDAAAHVKQTLRSLSIGIDRAGVGFAYLGCQVTRMRFFFDDGIPKVEYSIMGLEETTDYTPTSPTDPTEVPFGADETTVKVAASQRVDLDSLEITFDDNGEIKYNLSGQEAADYVKYGEFVGDASFEIDFESKADYALWKARTVQELIMNCTVDADQILDVEMHGGIYDTFEVGLTGLGDQVRASAGLRAVYATADTAAAQIVLTTAVQVTI